MWSICISLFGSGRQTYRSNYSDISLILNPIGIWDDLILSSYFYVNRSSTFLSDDLYPKGSRWAINIPVYMYQYPFISSAGPARPSSAGGPAPPTGGVMLPFGQPQHHGNHAPLPPPPTNEDSDVYELENFDGPTPRPHIPPPSTGPVVPIGDMPWYWGDISR